MLQKSINMLQEFNKSGVCVNPVNPVYKSLYEISFKFKPENEPTRAVLDFAQDNTVKYTLHKSNIVITLNINSDTQIKQTCEFFDNISETVITMHDTRGSITRRMVLEMSGNCLDDFSLCQDWNAQDELVTLDVTLKYKIITSEIIA